MAQDNLTSEIQHLIDRVNIVETIKRLAFHMDSKDWKSYEAEFADQVELDFTNTGFGGKSDRVAPRAQWAAAVASGLARFFETQHFHLGLLSRNQRRPCPRDYLLHRAPFHERSGRQQVRTGRGWLLHARTGENKRGVESQPQQADTAVGRGRSAGG